ncbi:site-specific integrase [Brevibacillus sp. SAFN-007a]|uniref:site-specific integrase n=1 Tax=Brevibacillus sp. SAFN-007a TaxID=3436862 RepID=UPI003F818445
MYNNSLTEEFSIDFFEELSFDLDIRQTISRTKAAGLYENKPKTPKSKREITIPEVVVNQLKNHYHNQLKTQEMMGSGYSNNDLVVSTLKGTPVEPRNLLRNFKQMIKKSGVRNIRFHDLRHTHASLLLAEGENIVVVADRLGHSKPGVTLNIYTHIIPGKQAEAAERIQRIIEKVKEDRISS